MFLVCNQCGNHNPEGAAVCSLCKDPLTDERLDQQRRSAWIQIPAALCVTAGLFFIPAIPVQLLLFMYMETTLVGAAFWVFYVLLWALGFGIDNLIKPKDTRDLDTGYRGGMLSLNPVTAARQNVDRAYVGIGLALFPIHMVKAMWAPVLENLRAKKR